MIFVSFIFCFAEFFGHFISFNFNFNVYIFRLRRKGSQGVSVIACESEIETQSAFIETQKSVSCQRCVVCKSHAQPNPRNSSSDVKDNYPIRNLVTIEKFPIEMILDKYFLGEKRKLSKRRELILHIPHSS